MRYSIEPRDLIFVKGYGLLSFAKNMHTNLGKNISKILSRKYSQKHLDHAKTFATDTLKTAPKKRISKATSDLIGNKIAYKIISNKRYIYIYIYTYIYPQKKDSKLLMN